MARCTMKMPEEFLLKISRLGNKTDEVCGRVLNAGAKVVLKKVRTNGESNAKIASVIEYGKSGQPPKPFMKPAKSASRKECMTVMINTLDEEVKSI